MFRGKRPKQPVLGSEEHATLAQTGQCAHVVGELGTSVTRSSDAIGNIVLADSGCDVMAWSKSARRSSVHQHREGGHSNVPAVLPILRPGNSFPTVRMPLPQSTWRMWQV